MRAKWLRTATLAESETLRSEKPPGATRSTEKGSQDNRLVKKAFCCQACAHLASFLESCSLEAELALA